ncbi:MAG: bifunctional metallophosphatase/5'-nucleotidase [Myxococcales bacterium]
MTRAARVSALVCALAFTACLDVQQGENPNLAGQKIRLTFLHTSDLHSRLLPYDLAPLKSDIDLGLTPEAPPYGGVSRLAALIKRERLRADRSMLVDSGDCFQGAPIFNAGNGEAEIRWQSLMNYDAVVIGNHEFDMGAHNYSDKIERFATYPVLASNYLWENTDAPNAHGIHRKSQPYTITNVRGVKVAVIGLANISSMNSIFQGGNSLQAIPLEQNETVRGYVDFLRSQADLIVILSHAGTHEDAELITGYEAYYPYASIKQFLKRPYKPWRQVEPAVEGETFPDGTVRVYIPGIEGIDLVEGGHLHVVYNPPQTVRDTAGRQVIISHSGAFSKYLGRLDTVLEFPPPPPDPEAGEEARRKWEERAQWGAEIVAHDYRVFPVDGLWCDDEARSWRGEMGSENFARAIHKRVGTVDCRNRYYQNLPPELEEKCLARYDNDERSFECDRFIPTDCLSRVEKCTTLEDRETTHLLQPYIMRLDQTFALPRIFAFAPRNIVRRNNSSGGDSPLGNMTAESMRVRQRVEAEFALTNTLGIRDNLYAGPVTLEGMFNVFPFENTINIMYLSGAEVQEMTDFVAERSAERGCQSQAQVSGLEFVMDCAQAVKNFERHPCNVDADCTKLGPVNHPEGWRCSQEKVCQAHASFDIVVNGKPLERNASYKVAVNDYIAKGGSGFAVLRRNTTRIETGISLRDSLIDWMRSQCTCEDILKEGPDEEKFAPGKLGKPGFPCANIREGGRRIIDQQVKDYCESARAFSKAYEDFKKTAGPDDRMPEATPVLSAGRCTCRDVVNRNEKACGHITNELKGYCSAPTRVPIAIGSEDGRIGRRVK